MRLCNASRVYYSIDAQLCIAVQELVDAVRCSGHWLCLHIAEEGLAPYSCFILHNPPTPFLLVASARKKHLLYILEALSLALECSGWTEVGLTGRHVDSLLDLMINRYSQVSSTIQTQNIG